MIPREGDGSILPSMDLNSVAVAVERDVDGFVAIAVDWKTSHSMTENHVWWAPMWVEIDP